MVIAGLAPRAIAQIDDATGEAAFVDQVEGNRRPRGERGQAPAHREWRHIQLVLVHQAGFDRVGGQGGAADADRAPLLQRADGRWCTRPAT